MGRVEEAICVAAYSTSAPVCSYTYRWWAAGTSFYLKQRSLDAIKISLHGPDLRHPEPGFKLGIDSSAQATAHEKLLWRFDDGAMGWFPGREIARGVRHVVRIRVPWDTMQAGRRAVDFDFFLAEGRPYWPNSRQIRKNRAGLGPLRNSAGQYLTAACYHRTTFDPAMAKVTQGRG
ncbi:hypothetical protein GCM10027445_24070 [Amycolatopsis endophytica]|uniref:Uncharacterized protein n=1 Tax=Amycolatopsis endophytica TaxID=860233 RepID=A0A853BE87_9PSEU|nr:hypothetical protein [Amycolatopsis endophytica]NYI93673.1 hypothetical protein [Amycolatopsis endophytica]